MDAIVFWIVQFLPGAIYFLDYYSKERTDFFYFMSKIFARGIEFHTVYLPHDARNTHPSSSTGSINLERCLCCVLFSRPGADPCFCPLNIDIL
jgi:hypothetical protein